MGAKTPYAEPGIGSKAGTANARLSGMAYVFVISSQGFEERLEPGPFDDELPGIVRAIETEQG